MNNSDYSEDFLPWWEESWQGYIKQVQSDRVPHALLITGPGGLGKYRFARELARALLCRQTGPQGRACGHCTVCKLGASSNHPDHMAVELLDDATEIQVDQIRELCANLALKSHAGGYKVATIHPADRMNISAANCLLKTLEEPTDNTVLLLVTEYPARLPATIRSRCQRIPMESPDTIQALEWLDRHGVGQDRDLLLRIAAGSPVRAKEYAERNIMELRRNQWSQLDALATGAGDPLQVAEQWAQGDVSVEIGWFADWLMDMIRLRLSPASPMLRNPDFQASFSKISRKLDHRTLFGLLDQVLAAHRLIATPVNQRLLLEEQLIAWTDANTGSGSVASSRTG